MKKIFIVNQAMGNGASKNEAEYIYEQLVSGFTYDMDGSIASEKGIDAIHLMYVFLKTIIKDEYQESIMSNEFVLK